VAIYDDAGTLVGRQRGERGVIAMEKPQDAPLFSCVMPGGWLTGLETRWPPRTSSVTSTSP
jgi:hypothetical protein